MAREVWNAIGLGISMLLGGLLLTSCCINPLAHGPHMLEVAAVVFFFGMAIGGAAWKLWPSRKGIIDYLAGL